VKQKNSHVWDRQAGEWYVDPPSCAHALFGVEIFSDLIVDPCCGMGNIVRAATSCEFEAIGSDIVDRSEFFRDAPHLLSPGPQDFLLRTDQWDGDIVMNPPYAASGDGRMRLEEAFVAHALSICSGKVAALLPCAWHAARRKFLDGRGLLRVWSLTPRPSMPPGAAVVSGTMPGGGMKDFAWYVFLRGYDGPTQIGHADRSAAYDSAKAWHWRRGRTKNA